MPGRRPPVHLMWWVLPGYSPRPPVTACRVPPVVLPVLALPVVVLPAEPLPELVLSAVMGALTEPGRPGPGNMWY